MDNANNIFERKNLDGSIDYVVNIGTLLYNNKIVSLSNLVIPLRQQTFFTLPTEKRYYAVVNVYYLIDEGIFLFDTVKKSENYLASYDSTAIANAIPIGQFILQQSLSSFEVKNINLYSNMSTFAVTKNFTQGDRGAKGEVGETGFIGYTGLQGITGMFGTMGITGAHGDTGIGPQGYTGPQGETGVYLDLDLLMYLKFKCDEDVVTDYSPYERDFLWGSTGAWVTGLVYEVPGYTGVPAYTGIGPEYTGIFGYTGISGYTGMVIYMIDLDQSDHTSEEGIIDNCHNVTYNGGRSGYTNDSYLGFTGTIQSWINVNQPPIADFIYEQEIGIGSYPVRFINTSLYYPDSTVWNIEGNIFDKGIFVYPFGETGVYVISLTATNQAGSSTRTEQITVV